MRWEVRCERTKPKGTRQKEMLLFSHTQRTMNGTEKTKERCCEWEKDGAKRQTKKKRKIRPCLGPLDREMDNWTGSARPACECTFVRRNSVKPKSNDDDDDWFQGTLSGGGEWGTQHEFLIAILALDH